MNIIQKIFTKDDSWIKDSFKTPRPLRGIIFLYVYYFGNLLADKLAIKITGLLHSEYVYDTPEFYKFLGTNPWEYVLIRFLWIVVLVFILSLGGMKFFYKYKENELERKNLIKWFIFGILSILVLQGISIILTQLNGSMTANQELLNKELLSTSLLKKIFVFVIIPAFGEELIMRGLVQRYIIPKLPIIGILLSAFLFQGMHFTTRVSDALLYFVSGLSYAIIYHKTNRLELPIALHAINNIFALFLIHLTIS